MPETLRCPSTPKLVLGGPHQPLLPHPEPLPLPLDPPQFPQESRSANSSHLRTPWDELRPPIVWILVTSPPLMRDPLSPWQHNGSNPHSSLYKDPHLISTEQEVVDQMTQGHRLKGRD